MISDYFKKLKELEDSKCKTCGGIGRCDDADIGDICCNTWICPICKGTGITPIESKE